MSLEDFKNLAAGIQSVSVALAVLIGGAWALFRFFSLKEVKKATTELEKTKRELQQRGHLQIEMQATQMFSSVCAEKYINVSLKVSNVGNRTEVIRWLDSKLGAAPVRMGTSGEVQLGEQIRVQVHSIHRDRDASTIDPGIPQTFAFLIPVETHGVYFIQSSLAGSPIETSVALEKVASAGLEAPIAAYWGAAMYFSVIEHMEESPNKTMQPTASGGG